MYNNPDNIGHLTFTVMLLLKYSLINGRGLFPTMLLSLPLRKKFYCPPADWSAL